MKGLTWRTELQRVLFLGMSGICPIPRGVRSTRQVAERGSGVPFSGVESGQERWQEDFGMAFLTGEPDFFLTLGPAVCGGILPRPRPAPAGGDRALRELSVGVLCLESQGGRRDPHSPHPTAPGSAWGSCLQFPTVSRHDTGLLCGHRCM